MKLYSIKIGFLLFAILILSNCDDDFLQREPLDEISNQTFWNTESDLRVYNNNLYNRTLNDGSVPILQGHDSYWTSTYYSVWYEDLYSDNIVWINPSRRDYQDISTGKHSISSSPRFYGYQGWDFVRAINVGLENYDKADVSETVRNKYIAEARLFRGWFYAHKVKRFGDVQWFDKPLNIDSPELYGSRTPREEVMTNVLADLNFACQHLPNDWGDGKSPGRVNRWAALLVKSRVALFEGTWRKYHGGSNPDMWLQEAADAAKELIEDGPYSLYMTADPEHDYNASHREFVDLTGNPEVIYWRKYEMGILSHNTMSFWSRHNGGATRSMVEDYLCTDGLPITLSPLYQGDAVYEDLFENRDPRLRQTILHPEDQEYYNYDGSLEYSYPRLEGRAGGNTNHTGYHIIKHYNSAQRFVSWNGDTHPAITLRLGEALLNYAEAKAELGSITQSDLDMSINKLRDRVAMPHMNLNNIPVDPRYVNDDVSPLIVEIRRERRVEMFMESRRYDDLMRWKQGEKLADPRWGMRWDDAAKAKYDPDGTVTKKSAIDPDRGIEYINAYKGLDWENPTFDESKHYLWPIPLSATAQNPEVGQNPGWE